MVGLLQLKLPTSPLAGFLINDLNESIAIYFFASGESRLSIPKIKRSDFSVSFPDFCFSNRKACDLCSPENLSGDHRNHRGKCENSGISPMLQMDQLRLEITPETKKPTRRPVGGEFSKWWSILRIFRNLLSTSKRRIFQVSNGRQFHLLEKFSARCFRIHAEPLS